MDPASTQQWGVGSSLTPARQGVRLCRVRGSPHGAGGGCWRRAGVLPGGCVRVSTPVGSGRRVVQEQFVETRWVSGGDFASARGGGCCGAVGRARDARCRRSVPRCRLVGCARWWRGGIGLDAQRGARVAPGEPAATRLPRPALNSARHVYSITVMCASLQRNLATQASSLVTNCRCWPGMSMTAQWTKPSAASPRP